MAATAVLWLEEPDDIDRQKRMMRLPVLALLALQMFPGHRRFLVDGHDCSYH